jgi:Sulfatase
MASRTSPIRLLCLRLFTVLALLTALRWVFFWVHREAFPALHVGQALSVAIQGARFDAMTVVVANPLFILLHLLPLPWRNKPWYGRMLAGLFFSVNTFLLLLCCVDLPFFGFNGKRITRDVFSQVDAGLRELPSFILRYWWATFTFGACVWLMVRSWRHIEPGMDIQVHRSMRSSVAGVLATGAFVLVGRGGWQYQALSPAHAADHVAVAFAPLVTNSAFTFGYSLSEPAFVAHAYMSAAELDQRMPLKYALRAETGDRKRNVVLLIVESLGREYISSISGERSYMPFLDSLCARSLVLTNAFANAERSNKSMCALLAGIPSFTEEAFMNTAYASNTVEGLGDRLKEMGYSTAFFHGGLNGEYKFDSFTRSCGFDAYFGKDEFNDDSQYDGHWGIFDEEFLQYAAERISDFPAPFCSAIFTLSSHDPFPLPARYKGRFPKGRQDIHESLGYADMAIRRFFQTASEQPWFANTVFVITGDHTYQYNDHPLWYRNPAGRFAVPIIFFSPDGAFSGHDDGIAQHLDLVPSILDIVGYTGSVNTFGQSIFRRDRTDRAVQCLGGQYRLIQNDRALLFDGTHAQGLFDLRRDTLFANDLGTVEPVVLERMTNDLKAIIQRYDVALTQNSLRER